MSTAGDDENSGPATSTSTPPPWGYVPPVESDDFQKFINRSPFDAGGKPTAFSPNDQEMSSWSDLTIKNSFASFGDSGVTASVNAYGDLMQFSSYLDVGRSGLFCADHTGTDHPYGELMRCDDLMNLSQDHSQEEITYGLKIPEVSLETCRHTGYVHDRWPRYEYGDVGDKLQMSMQWMVHEKTVLQQCVVSNNAKENTDIQIHFKNGMRIRDLDYVNTDSYIKDYHYFRSRHQDVHTHGPNDYGLVFSHPIETEPEEKHERNESQNRDREEESAATDSSSSRSSTKLATEHDGSDSRASIKQSDGPKSPPLGPHTISVVVSVFVNGSAVQWKTIDPLRITIPAEGTVEVVTAYRMVLLSNPQTSWHDFLIPPHEADVSGFLSSVTFKPIWLIQSDRSAESVMDIYSQGIEHQDLDSTSISETAQPMNSVVGSISFVVRRKLEHILSVCAIPTKIVEGGETAIALTCGDISGHLVSSSSSFFAFKFLLKILGEIEKCLEDVDEANAEHPYKLLRQRIHAVCRGHLLWLSQAEKTKSKSFAVNYWPTGKITDSEKSLDRAPNSVADTSLHIIKALEFAAQKTIKDNASKESARATALGIAANWEVLLKKLDERGSHAWPHTQVEGCNKYRLNDHVWIWRALLLIENDRGRHLGARIPTNGNATNNVENSSEGQRDNNSNRYTANKALDKYFDPREVQRSILRHFTAESGHSIKKRLLATTRSTQETRFLFHASDTALFYAIEQDFFLKETSFNEVWEDTIDAQAQYSENSETGWDNSVRYALAIMAGTWNKKINQRSPQELVKSSFDVLFRTVGPNGLFFGQLDITTKEPTLFEDYRDRAFYFDASFEIPYILLTRFRQIDYLIGPAVGENDKAPSAPPAFKTSEAVEASLHNPSDVANNGLPASIRQMAAIRTIELQNLKVASLTTTTTKDGAMKKRIPFNSFIDQSSIVELGDEWLYNYPHFFTATRLTHHIVAKEVADLAKETYTESEVSAVITDATQTYINRVNRDKENKSDTGVESEDGEAVWNEVVWVVDVRKMGRLKKKQREESFNPRRAEDAPELWRILMEPRTPANAKKRFIWLPNAGKERALACYVTSPEQERPRLSIFFDRHYRFEKHFSDETTRALNTWESELHLSFYRLVDENYKHSSGVSDSSLEILPINRKNSLARASVGFRFFGDFFDRYWTCHFIEYIPQGEVMPTWSFMYTPEYRKIPWGNAKDLVQEQQCWRQRKVLELHLFDRILRELVQSTQKVYNMVKGELGVKHGVVTISVLTSDDYFSSSDKWQRVQHILQVLEEDLSHVLSVVSKWETREKDRGHERPRWTSNDERKYRPFIGKLERVASRRIKDLQKYYNDIRSLRDTSNNSKQQIRDDLDLRGSENIRFFTYVTVVFLPLGFAASIFSMSEAPPGAVLQPMVVCSVIALALTFVALANAKQLNAIMGEITEVIDHHARARKRNSPLSHRPGKMKTYQQASDAYDGEKAVKDKSKPHIGSDAAQAALGAIAPTKDHSWHFWFWLAYVFVEVPARRVSLAIHVLKPRNYVNSKDGDDVKKDDAGRTEGEKWARYVHVVVGVFILPVYIITFLLQLLLYNLVDLFQITWEWLTGYFKWLDLGSEQDIGNDLDWLTYPMKKLRISKYRKSVEKQDGK